MIMTYNWAALAAGALALTACANASQPLTAEPPPGALKAGQVVYVDDGRCPAGQISRVAGAESLGGSKRERSCVAR